MIHTIWFSKNAIKQLNKLPRSIQHRLKKALPKIAKSPYPQRNNPKKLKGRNTLRFRSGEYRIIYVIVDSEVHITSIRHRKDVYRKI